MNKCSEHQMELHDCLMEKELSACKAERNEYRKFIEWVKGFSIMSDPYSREVSIKAEEVLVHRSGK